MKKTFAEKIATRYFKLKKKERENYDDIIMRGGNPFEYGMLGDEELLVKLLREFKISRKS